MFERAIELRTEAPLYHYNLGLAQLQAGNRTAAVQSFLHATRLEPGFFDAWAQLGTLYLGSGELDQAETAFQRALAAQPNHEIENHLGVVYLQRQDYARAREHFEASIRLNANYHLPHYNLGVVKQRQGDPAGAEQSYQRAIELKPDYFFAYYNIALVQLAQDKVDAARENLETFLRVSPADLTRPREDARNRLSELGE